jgi:WD40 repeat protein
VRTNSSLVDEPTASVMPLLASGGRDRLIHIYDVNRDYDVIETLDDHSASITTVKFACNGSKLLSCSADKSVVFRNVTAMGAGCKSIRYHQETVPRGTIYDLDTDPSDKLAITVSQVKKRFCFVLSSF